MSEERNKLEVPDIGLEEEDKSKYVFSPEYIEKLRTTGNFYNKKEEEEKKAKKRKARFKLVVFVLLIIGLFFGLSKCKSNNKAEDDVIVDEGNNDQDTKEDVKTETVPLYIDYANDIDDEAWDIISSAASKGGASIENLYVEELFSGSGMKAADVDLKSNKNETINLSKIEGPIVLEVIADWCQYCMLESTDYLSQAMADHPEATFVQYMHTGMEDEVRAFYTEINMNPQRGLNVVYTDGEFNSWLDECGFNSYPTFIFIDDQGKVSSFFSGVMLPETFNSVANVAFDSDIKTYDMLTKDGIKISELARKVKVANRYKNSLSEIEVPLDILYPDKKIED